MLTFWQKTIKLTVLQYRALLCFLAVLAVFGCAHKAPPLSKDRLSPRLEKISALNNRQIQFTFSEEIDTLLLSPENFVIATSDETLAVITMYASLSVWEIIAATDEQKDRIYEATGSIFDKGGNKGNFKMSFSGSMAKDTIVPWLVDYSRGVKKNYFHLSFSEAMDTSVMKFEIIPNRNFHATWLSYRTCELLPATPLDSLKLDTTYYLYIDKGARDISGNALEPFITSITPDTIYEPKILRGKVMLADTLVKSGRAWLARGASLGIAMLENGEFAFEVRDSLPYWVKVTSGEYSGIKEFKVGKEDTVFLRLEE